MYCYTETLLECRSAVAGDKSRFIDANDIARWFANNFICEIKTFMNYFSHKNIMINDLANDWEETIKFMCRPTILELRELQLFWRQNDKLITNNTAPSDRRKHWFTIADSGEIMRRKHRQNATMVKMSVVMREEKFVKRENEFFYHLLQNKNHRYCEMLKSKNGYTDDVAYFQRVIYDFIDIRAVITAHYGWIYYRGVSLQCFGYEISNSGSGIMEGNTDYLELYHEKSGDCDDDEKRKNRALEKILFKKSFANIINNYCLEALYNPHTELGRRHANNLYDENFS